MLFSIVTVNRNNSSGLEGTIKSVLLQQRDLYQYIIIDGASTDASIEVVGKYRSEIDVFVSEPDTGVYNAMNKSIRYLKGEYVIFMNSGDEFVSEDILSRVAKMNLDSDIIIGGMIRRKNGKDISKSIPNSEITLYSLLYKDVICHQATFTKVSLFKELGGYDESVRISADWAFLFDSIILNRKTFSVIPLYICYYDVTGMSGAKGANNIIRKEKLLHLKNKLPYVYNDYVRMHSVYRLSPKNVFKYLKWKFFDI